MHCTFYMRTQPEPNAESDGDANRRCDHNRYANEGPVGAPMGYNSAQQQQLIKCAHELCAHELYVHISLPTMDRYAFMYFPCTTSTLVGITF